MNRGEEPFIVSGKVNGMSTRDAADFLFDKIKLMK